MSFFLQELLVAAVLAAIYSLVAVSLTFVYVVSDVLQFAQGDLMIVGAYSGYVALQVEKNVLVALVIGTISTAIAGVALYAGIFRWMEGRGPLPPLLAGIALSSGIEALLTNGVNSGLPISYPQNAGGFGSGDETSVIVLVISAVAGLAFYQLLHRTNLGRGMRAVADDASIARLLGVRVRHVVGIAFALGTGLAGAAGVLLAILYGSVSPTGGLNLEFTAVAIVLFGGLGSVGGALIGALLLAFGQTFIGVYVSSTYEAAVTFGLILIVAVARPTGIMPVKTETRA